MMRRSLIFEISCCLLLPITCLCLHNFFFYRSWGETACHDAL